jgi:predicted TIM-barrel fold metal-dependent hydrolase
MAETLSIVDTHVHLWNPEQAQGLPHHTEHPLLCENKGKQMVDTDILNSGTDNAWFVDYELQERRVSCTWCEIEQN